MNNTNQITLNTTPEIETRDTDGYINATKLCQSVDKKFNDFTRLKQSTQIIEELSKSLDISIDILIQKIQGGTPDKQGSWIHPSLLPHLSNWVNLPKTSRPNSIIYIISSHLLQFVKVGYWRADIKSLFARYRTSYGKHFHCYIFNFDTINNCIDMEQLFFNTFKEYKVEDDSEFYDKTYLSKYLEFLRTKNNNVDYDLYVNSKKQ
jgi:hypothetical protein